MVRPRQPPSQTWRTFLRNHLGQIVAADFFVVPTVTCRLVFVLVLLAHDRRRIRHVAVTTRPTVWGPPRGRWRLTTCSRRHTRRGKMRLSSDLLDPLGGSVSIT